MLYLCIAMRRYKPLDPFRFVTLLIIRGTLFMCSTQRKVDPGRLSQALQCRHIISELLKGNVLEDIDPDALAAALAALDNIDGRSSNRTIREAFYTAQQQMLYALRLKTPR